MPIKQFFCDQCGDSGRSQLFCTLSDMIDESGAFPKTDYKDEDRILDILQAALDVARERAKQGGGA
jgi:hypothetical protein